MRRLSAWRPCTTCGDHFVASRYRPQQTYCSDKCRYARLDPAWRTCDGCGGSYQAKAVRVRKGEGLKYCSRECAFGDQTAWHRSSAVDVEAGRAAADRKRLYAEQMASPFECEQCGEPAERRAVNQRYCGRLCSNRASYGRGLLSRGHTPRWRWRAEAETRRHFCEQCEGAFTAPSNGAPKYCEGCRPRRSGASGHRFLRHLLERDGRICQLCGERVGSETYPHPRAPTVDHIIPRSKGGPNTKANVQLAHLSCNMAKSNGSVGSQLLLVG